MRYTPKLPHSKISRYKDRDNNPPLKEDRPQFSTVLCSRLVRQLPKNLLQNLQPSIYPAPNGENWANSGKSKVFNAFEVFTSRFRANEIVENSKLHFPCRHGRGFILIIERTTPFSLLHRYPRFSFQLPSSSSNKPVRKIDSNRFRSNTSRHECE